MDRKENGFIFNKYEKWQQPMAKKTRHTRPFKQRKPGITIGKEGQSKIFQTPNMVIK